MIYLFCGPSGSGKTTLCKYLDKEKGIPFIETSSKPLWHKHGITGHRQILMKSTNNWQWGIDFQNELLDMREKIYSENITFCSDRSPLDNAAYFLLQNAPYATELQTKKYLERCFDLAKIADKIIRLRSFDTKVPDDGMRIDNQYYQDVFNNTMEMVITSYGKPNVMEIKNKALPARKEALNILIEGMEKLQDKRGKLL